MIYLQNSFSFYPLAWDSKYFGIPCARIDIYDLIPEKDFLNALSMANNYRFVSIANINCCVHNSKLIAEYTNAFVVDTNIQFRKSLLPAQNNITKNGQINIMDCCPYQQSICDLAENGFNFSRFFVDEKLYNLGGKNIYNEWVKNAFNQRGKYFLIYKSDGILKGFILFSTYKCKVKIELICVSMKHRNAGIGRKLWNALENYSMKLGCNVIMVGTQLVNVSACNFYFKSGCKFDSISQIYHLWNKN